MIAAKTEARLGRFSRLGIGFNWAYRRGPAERAFWASLGRVGGRSFDDAVDWVGLDAYPGTSGPALDGAISPRGRERPRCTPSRSCARGSCPWRA